MSASVIPSVSVPLSRTKVRGKMELRQRGYLMVSGKFLHKAFKMPHRPCYLAAATDRGSTAIYAIERSPLTRSLSAPLDGDGELRLERWPIHAEPVNSTENLSVAPSNKEQEEPREKVGALVPVEKGGPLVTVVNEPLPAIGRRIAWGQIAVQLLTLAMVGLIVVMYFWTPADQTGKLMVSFIGLSVCGWVAYINRTV